jgi:hypothetical protein
MLNKTRLGRKSRAESIMVGELATGLFAIAIAIGLGLFPIWFILRRESSRSQNIEREIQAIKPLLNDMIISAIDEKIAMLYTYETMARGWERIETTRLETERKLLLNKMKSDIRALSRMKSMMTSDQKELSHSAIRTVVQELRNRAQNDIANDIENILTALLS